MSASLKRLCTHVLLACLLAISAPVTVLAADPALQQRLYFAMNAPDRPDQDTARDIYRKPVEVLEFFGVEAGMVVLDLMAGTGYFTEMLSAGVGPQGKVYAHNDLMALRMRNGGLQKAMDARLSGKRLPNTQMWTTKITELGLNREIDLATLILNLHDLNLYGGAQEVAAALASIMNALKPGGILGVIDHAGNPGPASSRLHRIDPGLAEDLLERAGFIIIDRSSLLANPADDRSLHVFDPAIRGRTDQFIIKAMKPRS